MLYVIMVNIKGYLLISSVRICRIRIKIRVRVRVRGLGIRIRLRD